MPSYRLDPEDVADFDQLVPDFIRLAVDIDDPRVRGRTAHRLTTVLFVCVSASMAGAKSVNAFGQFAADAWDWITASLGDGVGATPVSHDTIGRLLQKLRPDVLEGLLAELAARKTALRPEPHVAIDGKRQSGTARKDLTDLALADGGEQAFTTVTAYGVDSGLVLGCHTSKAPGSEHACVAEVLGMIDLRGATVTMDAGNAYAKFCDPILAGGGAYLACVKGNNARTRELCRRVFDAGVDRAYDAHAETVAARGDTRAVRTAALDPGRSVGHGTGACDAELLGRWPGAACVVEVERRRRTRTREVDGRGEPKASWHVVHYVSSRALSAAEAARLARSHWHVENKVHWTLDVSYGEDAYGEDASRARTGYIAENLAAVKRLANNMLAAVTGRASTRRYQMKFAVDPAWRDQVWGLI